MTEKGSLRSLQSYMSSVSISHLEQGCGVLCGECDWKQEGRKRIYLSVHSSAFWDQGSKCCVLSALQYWRHFNRWVLLMRSHFNSNKFTFNIWWMNSEENKTASDSLLIFYSWMLQKLTMWIPFAVTNSLEVIY